MITKSKKAKQQIERFIDQNPAEVLKDMGEGVAKSLVEDFAKGATSDLWKQLLGIEAQKSRKGELYEGEEINIKALEERIHTEYIEPGINYRREIIHAEDKAIGEDKREIEVKIQEILIEIKNIISSSKELQIAFKEIAKEQRVENIGKYHLSFFEWVLTSIRSAVAKIEDSASWLAAFHSKRDKRQYWAMFKKHGTSFGLSGERVIATQTG